jgi:hypothetical protein
VQVLGEQVPELIAASAPRTKLVKGGKQVRKKSRILAVREPVSLKKKPKWDFYLGRTKRLNIKIKKSGAPISGHPTASWLRR